MATNWQTKIRPFDLDSQAQAAKGLVLHYEPMLTRQGPDKARLWLSGLEAALQRARDFDAEFDRRLAEILHHQPLPVCKPKVCAWVHNTLPREKQRRRVNYGATRSALERADIPIEAVREIA